MNIITPSLPARLRITQDQWTELLTDPVMAAEILLGIKLDIFQACRLRIYWWYPEVIDSSGFSSGKTIVDWVFTVLRAILLPDQHIAVYYPVFETGKRSYWLYMNSCRSRYFHAHLGRVDEKGDDSGAGKIEGGGGHRAFFRNGSIIHLPPPSFMKRSATQASLRLNTLLVEEGTHIDDLWGNGEAGGQRSSGIDEQLKGRCSRQSWNQHHPIWCNHILLTAPAKTQLHPGFPRYESLQRDVDRGNPSTMTCTFNYKDYSGRRCHSGKTFREEYRVQATINSLKRSMGKAEFMGEGLGLWARSGIGWFTEVMLLNAVDLGRRRGLLPMVGRN